MWHQHKSQKQQNKLNNSDLSPSIRESIHAMLAIHDRSPREVAQHHGLTIREAVAVALQLAHDRGLKAGVALERGRYWRRA